jgi:hypothetical protein
VLPTYSLIDVTGAVVAALWSLLAFLFPLWLGALGIRVLRCF